MPLEGGDEALELRILDESDIIFPNRVSSLKVEVKNVSERPLSSIVLVPAKEVIAKGTVEGHVEDLRVMWGGGFREGAHVLLPGDKETLKPGESGVVYFLLYYPSRKRVRLTLPLDAYVSGHYLGRFNVDLRIYTRDVRGYIYRPRYCPKICEDLLTLVRDVLSEYGVPSIEIQAWHGLLGPRVQVFFEGREVANITGHVGTGIRHLSKIDVHHDIFVGRAREPKSSIRRWYWVVRVWFFWVIRSYFDEVPDAERVELWINPDTSMVDWVVTDEHWKEVAYKGPTRCAEVKLVSTTDTGISFKRLVRFVRSYHPPVVTNMDVGKVSDDSRSPHGSPVTIFE